MNFIARVMLLFTDEPGCFWIMVTLVEDLLASDFFSEPPAELNGLLAEADVMHELCERAYPDLALLFGHSSSAPSEEFSECIQARFS